MNNPTRSTILVRILTLIIVSILAFTAQAKVYKWTDENGKVHYSDKPIDEKSQQIKMKSEPTASEVLKAKQRAAVLIRHQNKVQAIADEEARDKQIVDNKKTKERNKAVQMCNEAKRLIRVYSRGRPIYTTDQNGKKNYKSYSDKQKNEMIADLQKFIKSSCTETE